MGKEVRIRIDRVDYELGSRSPLITVKFKDKEGRELSWSPKYSELKDILSPLILSYGKKEIISKVIGDEESYEDYLTRASS